MPCTNTAGTVDTENVPAEVGHAVISGLASLYELQTIYSPRDLYQLLEIASVRNYNANKVQEYQNRQNANG